MSTAKRTSFNFDFSGWSKIMESCRLQYKKICLFLFGRSSVSTERREDRESNSSPKQVDYFIPENKVGEDRIVNSEDGKYKLVMETYKTSKGGWNYSRGLIYCGDKLIADVKRNYLSFGYAWILNHKNGHDYLLCGEDYQGMTCIELDTGKRVDYLPKAAKKGAGWCWVEAIPNESKTKLALNGCVWACPYEWMIVDFTNPMVLPYPLLNVKQEINEFLEWKSEDEVLIGEYRRDFRISDGKPLDNLTKTELESICNLSDEEYSKVVEERVVGQTVWKLPTAEMLILEYKGWLESVYEDYIDDVKAYFRNLWAILPEREKEFIYKRHSFLLDIV